MIEVNRTLTRRHPCVAVVEIGPEGITFRRYRGRRRFFISWDQVACCDTDPRSLCHTAEVVAGRRFLDSLSRSANHEASAEPPAA